MSQARVLVTGASGFVGASVKAAFEDAGALVTGVDIREAEGVLKLDLSDDLAIRRLLQSDGYDVIAHLAAAGVGSLGLKASARMDPLKAVSVNVGDTVNLLQLAKQRGVRRFIYASSTTVYGSASSYGLARITEEAAFRPMSFYGATKASAEHLGRTLLCDSETQFVALRLPLVYGAKRWYGGAIAPLLEIVAAMKEQRHASVSLSTTQTDWVHVDDAARAFVAISENPSPALAYHVVGHTGSMFELGRRLTEFTSVEDVLLGPDDTDSEQGLPLISDALARHDLDFQPVYSSACSAAQDLFG